MQLTQVTDSKNATVHTPEPSGNLNGKSEKNQDIRWEANINYIWVTFA